MKKTFCYLLLLFISNISAQESPGDIDPGIVINNYVNKTALFPGDHITYVIEVICDSDVDILPDDLAKDELILNGLELISSNVEQNITDNGTRYTFRYVLSTYASNTTPLGIEELRVRYYFKRPGQQIEDIATVGEMTISSVNLVLASTLPASLENLQLRDIQLPEVTASGNKWIGTAGIVLILVSMFPVGSAAYAYLQKRKMDRQAEQVKESVTVSNNIFNDLGAIAVSNDSNRREAFQQLESIIRGFIEHTTGLDTRALTTSDLLQQKAFRDSSLPLRELISVLSHCEYARYGTDKNLPEVEEFNQGFKVTQRLVTGS